MILELPPQLEQVIVANAHYAGVGVNEFIVNQLQTLNTIPKKERKLGGGEQYFVAMADDFDEPLDDFKDYM